MREPLTRYLSLVSMESQLTRPLAKPDSGFLQQLAEWDGAKPLKIGQVHRDVLWQNYDNCLTRHFVVDGGWQARIGDADAAAARATLGKFDVILDFDGLPRESADLLLRVLGIRPTLESHPGLLRHKEHNQTAASAVNATARATFLAQNRHDAAVHADAREKIRAHWARLTGGPG